MGKHQKAPKYVEGMSKDRGTEGQKTMKTESKREQLERWGEIMKKTDKQLKNINGKIANSSRLVDIKANLQVKRLTLFYRKRTNRFKPQHPSTENIYVKPCVRHQVNSIHY